MTNSQILQLKLSKVFEAQTRSFFIKYNLSCILGSTYHKYPAIAGLSSNDQVVILVECDLHRSEGCTNVTTSLSDLCEVYQYLGVSHIYVKQVYVPIFSCNIKIILSRLVNPRTTLRSTPSGKQAFFSTDLSEGVLNGEEDYSYCLIHNYCQSFRAMEDSETCCFLKLCEMRLLRTS